MYFGLVEVEDVDMVWYSDATKNTALYKEDELPVDSVKT